MNFPLLYYIIFILFLFTENVFRVGIIFYTYFLSTINVSRVVIIVNNNFRLVKKTIVQILLELGLKKLLFLFYG